MKSYVNRAAARHPNHSIVLTGHSLGGGIAQIAASQLNLPALVWSAPGVMYSASKFNISAQNSRRNVWVVMPDNDVVPRVDLQAGNVERIMCRTKNGDQELPQSCHSLFKTTCEVFRLCGDGRNFTACHDYVKPEQLGKNYRFD